MTMNAFNKSLFALLGALTLSFAAPAQATPIDLTISVTKSTYKVRGTETAADLLAAHEAGALVCTAAVGELTNIGSVQTCGGARRNYSLRADATFVVTTAATFDFQVGADWGRGGGVILEDLHDGSSELLQLRTDDIWWARRWSHRDVFNTEVELDEGAYRVTWVGFENCCGGTTDFRVSVNGGGYEAFSADYVAPYVAYYDSATMRPVPAPASTAALAALFALLRIRRRVR